MLISVIIPIYNAEKYLKECINSVINQTYENLELLLIDDGSTDNSGEIIDEYAVKDKRVKVFHKENGGTHTARNLGLAEAKGEYVMFMDPDDWLDEDTLKCLADKISEYNLDVVRFNYIREFADTRVKKENTFLRESVYRGDECREVFRQAIGLVGEELAHPESLNFLASVCFGAYRKSIISEKGIEFFNIRKIGSFSDGLFNIEVLKYVESFLFIDKGFYHYRKTNINSATSNYRENFPEKQALLFEKIADIIESSPEKEVKEAFLNRIALNTMELCLNALRSKNVFYHKLREIGTILNDERRKKAIKSLNIKNMPMKWKLYFEFMKIRNVHLVYFFTYMIQKLKSRG